MARRSYWHLALRALLISPELPAMRELLAKPGVDVNEQSSEGYTALSMAAYNGHASIVDARCWLPVRPTSRTRTARPRAKCL